MYKNNLNEIAYLIQAYSDAYAFKKLVETLLSMNNCQIFVHLDKKAKIDLFQVADERVHFIEKREFVSWAGYKQGKLINNLIDYCISYEKKFDYYCFISESDFPVYNNKELLEKINESPYIVMNCSIYHPQKIERYWFYDFNVKSPKLNKILSKCFNFLFGVLYKIGIAKKDNKILINGEQRDVYMSGPFWCFNYEVLSYISSVFNENKKLKAYFKHSFACCELIIPTIIYNSKYKYLCEEKHEYVNLNNLSGLCYFEYNGPRVNVLTEKSYDNIIKSNKPFIRKVKYNQSNELLKKIKQNWS